MAKACCIWLISLFYLHVQAQPGFQLSGKVTDTAGMSLSLATVQWIAASDTLNTLTGDDGIFSMKNLMVRKFKISITMKGFLPFSHSYTLAPDKHSIQLQPIALHADYSELDPVTVTRIRPISIQGDTVSYNAAAFPVRDGSEVEDILKRLPGLEVDMDGNVIVQGKPLSKVLVNGKEFFGSDILLAIQNLPADVVEKLQIIDDYGDKARLTGVKSSESGKVLNIVLEQDKRNGEFGRIQTGGGTFNKYAFNAFGNKFNGDQQISMTGTLSDNSPAGSDFAHNANFNYADQLNPRLSGSINGSNTAQAPQSSMNTIQYNYYPGEQLHQTQNSHTNEQNTANNFNEILTFNPDKNSMLRFNSGMAIQHTLTKSIDSFTTYQQDSGFYKSTNGFTLNNTQSTAESFNTNIYYQNISPKSRRRFNAQAYAGYSDSRQFNDNLSQASVVTDSISANSLLHYLVTNISTNLNLSLNVTYFIPLSYSSYLELGYKGQSSQSHTDFVTRSPDGAGIAPEIIDSLSQNQNLRTTSQNIHTAYSAHSNQMDISVGLDGQPGSITGSADAKGDIISYRYFSFVPAVQGSWAFDKSNKLNWSYNGQPNLPTLQQLSPYPDLTNPQYPVTGNPALKPSYSNTASVHFDESLFRPNQFQGFLVGLTYTNIIHPIIQNITHPKDSTQVIQSTSYVNAWTSNSISADYRFTLPSLFEKSLRIAFYCGITKSKTQTLTDGLLYNNKNLTLSQSVHLQLLLPDHIEAELEGNYTISNMSYPGSDSLPNTFKTASITFDCKQFIFRDWIINYRLSQPYTSSGNSLQVAPAILTASFQKEFLAHKKATITITGYNLLNTNGSAQSSSVNSIARSTAQLVGRRLFCSFILKLNQFKP